MTLSSARTLQVDIKDSLACNIIEWGRANIRDDELFKDGRENDVHITILYNVFSPLKTIRNVFKNEKPFKITLGDITAFQKRDKYDVLKIDVQGERIFRLYKIANNDILNKSKYPVFHPHITIAYLNEGSAVLSRIDKKKFNGIVVDVNDLVVTTSSSKHTIEFCE